MQHPEYLYYAAIVFVAWPSSPINRVAAVVVGVWGLGQILYWLGWPEPQTQTVIYSVALLLAVLSSRTTACMMSAMLFLPLAVVSGLNGINALDPLHAWWLIFVMAMLQTFLLPFGNDWATARDAWRAFKDDDLIDRILRRAWAFSI